MGYKIMAYSINRESPSYTNGSRHKNVGHTMQPVLQAWLITRASILARRGRFKKAEELLVPWVLSGSSSAESVDLLARIYAQQGRTTEAQALWCRALEMNLGQTRSEKALERCIDGVRREYMPLITFSLAVTIVICMLLASSYFYISPIRNFTDSILAGSVPTQEPDGNAQAALVSTQGEEQGTAERIEEIALVEPLPMMDTEQAFIDLPSPQLVIDQSMLQHEDQETPVLSTVEIGESELSGEITQPNISEPVLIVEEKRSNLSVQEQGEVDLLARIQEMLAQDENLAGLNLTLEESESIIRIVGDIPRPQIRELIESTVQSAAGAYELDVSQLKLIDSYVVRPGDRLIDIAHRFYGDKGSYHRIAQYNHLSSPNDIRFGQVLRLPR